MRLALATATLIGTLALAGTAGATAPVTGTFAVSIHYVAPAGTACPFELSVDIDGTGRYSIYDNPPRNLQHYEEHGTISGNGRSLIVDDHFNVTTTPPTSPADEQGVFTQRGAAVHVQVPGGGIVLLDAGYLVTLYPSGSVVVSHGQFPFEVEGDVSSLCAALAA
jgi:hypothetical protein